MLWLIIGAIVIGVAVLWPTYKPGVDRYEQSRVAVPRSIKLLGVFAGLVIACLSLITIVPARSYGVVTSFSKPTGRNLDSGLHLKAPWHKVTDMDGTIQQINNDGTPPPPDSDEAKEVERARGKTEVRLNNQSVMYVENVMRWRIKQDAADTLFQDWKEFERIDPGLVSKELAAALNVALADYNPYVAPDKAPAKDGLANEVREVLVGADGQSGKIGDQIEIVSLSIIKVDFDEKTQANINNLQAEVARTATATQEIATAEQKKLAADKTAQITTPSLITRCLDIQQQAVEKGLGLIGAPSCFTGNSARVVAPPNR
jgi:regulator of protease activity HflC (stomatin/prohibitin superfamily)